MNNPKDRKITRYVALGLIAIVVGACSGSTPSASTNGAPVSSAPASSAPASSAPANPSGFTYGHSYQDLSNPFFATELTAEQKTSAEHGITIVETQASDNPATQLDDINNLISRKVDVLVIDAIDPDAVVPGIKAANQANIPVIMLIRQPSGGDYKSLLYLDSVKDGFNACDAIAKKLGGKGNVVNLAGPLQIAAAKDRKDGCDQAFANYPGITIVSETATDYTTNDAETKMTDILTAHPNVDAVFGGNDAVAMGAVQAFISAGQDPKTKLVVGVDGDETALEEVCQGKMFMTFATFPGKEASMVYDLVSKVHAGSTVDPKVLFAAEPIDSSNVVQADLDNYGKTLTGCVK